MIKKLNRLISSVIKVNSAIVPKLLILLVIFSLGLGVGKQTLSKDQPAVSSNEEKNTPKAFISEVYDKIKENYWDNISDAQLLDLFKLSFGKNGGQITSAHFNSKEKLLKAITENTKNMPEEQRNKFVSSVAGSVLASLNPPGRSGLYTQKLETQLKNTVQNINPDKDLYKDLGLSKGASEDQVKDAYQKKEGELKKENTPQAQEKLKEVAYAKEVLTEKDKKLRYDESGIEPTIFSKIVKSGILYVQFKKFSPTSYDEFVKAFNLYKDDAALTGLIFDLRGNVGGAIDVTPYFLGHFIGKNQYAFDFYHKGEYLPFKTPTDKLVPIAKYKQVVILVDNQTQSSAEIMAATFKKYHIGVLVGVPTKGWGTVERVFPLENQIDPNEKYSVFLVHSITLRDDNLPIEGRGVEPNVNIQVQGWEQQLQSYFSNPQVVAAVKQVMQF